MSRNYTSSSPSASVGVLWNCCFLNNVYYWEFVLRRKNGIGTEEVPLMLVSVMRYLIKKKYVMKLGPSVGALG
jgi:hypothetical protein